MDLSIAKHASRVPDVSACRCRLNSGRYKNLLAGIMGSNSIVEGYHTRNYGIRTTRRDKGQVLRATSKK